MPTDGGVPFSTAMTLYRVRSREVSEAVLASDRDLYVFFAYLGAETADQRNIVHVPLPYFS